MSTVSEQLIEVIQVVSEKLGVAAEALYPILIKQAYVEGVEVLIQGLLSLVIAFISLKGVRHIWKSYRKQRLSDKGIDDGEGFFMFIGVFLLSLICIFFFVLGVEQVTDSIGAFLNPEWYALEMLLDKIK